ncbi:hypothetical protein ES706_01427 [subsurface metagenome]
MKQIELAQRLGISRAYISMLAKGERKPSKKLQRKIQKLTRECSLADTLLGNGVQVVGGSNPLTPTKPNLVISVWKMKARSASLPLGFAFYNFF